MVVESTVTGFCGIMARRCMGPHHFVIAGSGRKLDGQNLLDDGFCKEISDFGNIPSVASLGGTKNT